MVKLYITVNALPTGEKVNQAYITSDTPNSNIETSEDISFIADFYYNLNNGHLYVAQNKKKGNKKSICLFTNCTTGFCFITTHFIST